jgi:hypothetical protein
MLTTTAALDDYRRHAELYGPELVVETADHDLDERELAELSSGRSLTADGGSTRTSRAVAEHSVAA